MIYKNNIFSFFLVNAFIGAFCYKFPFLSNLLCIYNLFIGIGYAISKNVPKAIYRLIFISTFGIIMRVLKVAIFYEFDKYAVIILSSLILINSSEIIISSSKRYIMFLLLLVPGMIICGFDYNYMSLYISGPTALAFSALLFSGLKSSTLDLKKLFYSSLSPMIMFSIIILIHLVFNLDNLIIRNTTVENKVTSGGFGPNQVSTILGFGMITCIVLFSLSKNINSRVMLSLFWILLTIQAGISYSRGGLYGGLIGTIIIGIFSFNKRLLTVIIILSLMLFGSIKLVFSKQDLFSDQQSQAIFDRVTLFTTTGRVKVIFEDINTFLNNPFLGVGVGGSTEYHIKDDFGGNVGSHTFFTRLWAEHGFLGIICTLILMTTTLRVLYYNGSNEIRAILFSLIVWSNFTMGHNDLRLGLPAVIFSLCEYISKKKYL